MNIYEIAEKAGVSIATVSRVINKSSKVSNKTREKIEQLMEEEHYIPSAYARGLSGSPGKSIGILTIDVRDQYFAAVIYAMEQEFSLHQYNLILCNTGGELDTQRNYISLLIQKKVDALILVGSVFNYPELRETLLRVAKKIPIIIVNESLEGDNIYSVISDENNGISSAVKYLYNKGHRDFVYIKEGSTFSSNRKLSGIDNDEIRKLGIVTNGRFINIEKGLDPAIKSVDSILKMKPKPTAIVCGEDLTAMGIVQELTKRGYNVPEDFSVTGFNNLIYSRCSYPQLTTIDSQSNEMGLTAARMTLDILGKKSVKKSVLIKTELIIREST